MTTPPEIVLVGHIARDVQPDGTLRAGGTVTYGALLAARLGARPGVVTSAPPEDADRLAALVPTAQIVNVPSPDPTVFVNRYHGGQRAQVLRSRAAPLPPEAVPADWRTAPVTLLGPIAAEIPPELAATLAGPLRAATPQGWLRSWDAAGNVAPTPWRQADQIVPYLTAVILSVEDLAIASGAADRDATIAAWARQTPYVVVTDGPRGAALWEQGWGPRHVPAFPADEVDPTGAGDCFAVAFLLALWRGGDALAATRMAHAAASFVVRRSGTAGVPSADEVAALLASGA